MILFENYFQNSLKKSRTKMTFMCIVCILTYFDTFFASLAVQIRLPQNMLSRMQNEMSGN